MANQRSRPLTAVDGDARFSLDAPLWAVIEASHAIVGLKSRESSTFCQFSLTGFPDELIK